jgi:hypothetical protein
VTLHEGRIPDQKHRLLNLDTASTVRFVEFMLCCTNKCTKFWLTLFYFLQIQHVSMPKHHNQAAVRMLKLQPFECTRLYI